MSRRSLIKQLIGGDLGRWHELWPEVDMLNILTSSNVALNCWSIRFHTLYNVLLNAGDDNDVYKLM